MAWLACDDNGIEWIFNTKPWRRNLGWHRVFDQINLPSGTIEKIIGRPLTWADDAVEI